MIMDRRNKTVFIVTGAICILTGLLFNPIYTELNLSANERIESGLIEFTVIFLDLLFLFTGLLLIRLGKRKQAPVFLQKLVPNFLRLFMGLMLALLIAEIFVRIAMPFPRRQNFSHLERDPVMGWRLKAGKKYDFSTWETHYKGEINEMGYRGKLPGEKSQDKKNAIGFFGDSFTLSYEVADSQTFEEILESHYLSPGTATYNFGVSGYGPHQAFKRYLEYSQKIKLDTVVLMFFVGNDFMDLNPIFSSFYKYSRPSLFLHGDTLDYVPVVYGLRDDLRDMAGDYSPEIQLFNYFQFINWSRLGTPDPSPGHYLDQIIRDSANQALYKMEIILSQFAAVTRENNQVFIVSMIPSWNQIKDAAKEESFTISQREDLVFLAEYFSTLGNDYGFFFHDLSHPMIIETQMGKELYFKENLHFTPVGHEVVAKSLSQFLKSLRDQKKPARKRKPNYFRGEISPVEKVFFQRVASTNLGSVRNVAD